MITGTVGEIDVKVVKTIKHRDHDEPLVLDGDGAAPPEDVGGPAGYADFLAHHQRRGTVPSGNICWNGPKTRDIWIISI